MTVRSALARINEILDQVLNEQEGDFDAATRFAIAWYRQHGYATGKFGVADDLARARNTAVETMVRDGILTSAAGKVTLLSPADMPEDYDVLADDRVGAWEVLHHLIAFLERDGLPVAGAFLASAQERPDGAIDTELVKELAFLLFSIAEKNGWTQDALAFNTVATAWPDIVHAARSTQTGTRRAGRVRLRGGLTDGDSPTATASARCSSCSRRRSTTSSRARSLRSCPRVPSWTALVAMKDKKKGIEGKEYDRLDPQVQLRMLTENIPHNLKPGWYPFDDAIGRVGQGYAKELREARNDWAHNKSFSDDDAYRCLDTARAAARRDRRAGGRRRGQGDPPGPAPPDRRQGRPEGPEVGGGHARVGGAAPVARGPRAPRRRRDRQLPGRRVRRRPLQGRRDRGRRQGLRRAGPVLRAHLPHRGPARPHRPRGAAPGGRPERLAGHQPADELRRRQDALDARAVAPGVRHAARRLPAGRPGPARRDAASTSWPAASGASRSSATTSRRRAR